MFPSSTRPPTLVAASPAKYIRAIQFQTPQESVRTLNATPLTLEHDASGKPHHDLEAVYQDRTSALRYLFTRYGHHYPMLSVDANIDDMPITLNN